MQLYTFNELNNHSEKGNGDIDMRETERECVLLSKEPHSKRIRSFDRFKF